MFFRKINYKYKNYKMIFTKICHIDLFFLEYFLQNMILFYHIFIYKGDNTNDQKHSSCTISVAFIRPTSFKSLAICLTSAAIGSLISDIDITTSKSRKDLDIIILVSVIAVALLNLVYAWNEFTFSINFVSDECFYTIPIGIMSFSQALYTNWVVLLAGIVLSIIPVLIVFIAFQKYFVTGLTAGSVKE